MIKNIVGWLRSEAIRNRHLPLARLIGAGWARMDYAVRVEPTWLELNRIDIPIADLPSAFHGYRIAHLTDLHAGRLVTTEYLHQAVDLTHAQNPHAVVLTGDFIHHGFKHVKRVAEIAGSIKAPHGVFAVLGNHDYSVRNATGLRRHKHLHRAVADSLSENGIRVLRNETILLRQDQDELHLVGVEDLWSRACDLGKAFADVCPSKPRILLAHNPRTAEFLDGRRCDLMLSGHTHGGQVLIPGLGRPTLSKKAKRLAAGLYRNGNGHIYVNKGVGFGFRVRYGVRPEVAILHLSRAAQ